MRFQSYRVALAATLFSLAYSTLPTAAQPYPIKTRAETFVPLTNPIEVYGPNQDDQVRQLPLPFPVEYYGATFNEVSASTNGILFMGHSSNSIYNNRVLHSAAGPDNYIAPLWDDLATGNTSDPGHLAHATTGTAPNRVFTVEWLNFSRRDLRWSMQLRFFESGSPLFEVAYGTPNAEANLDDLTATLGMRGPTATATAAFVNPATQAPYACAPRCTDSALAPLANQVMVVGDYGPNDYEVVMVADSLPRGVLAGTTGQTQVTVRNPTPNEAVVVTGLYLSPDATFDQSDLQVAITPAQTIPAKGRLAIDLNYTIPNVDLSSYTHLIAATDVTNALDEISETNNAVARPVITNYDLHPTALTNPDIMVPGVATEYTVTVEDLGAPYIGPVLVRMYAHQGTSFDPATATQLFDYTATPVHTEGNLSTLTGQATLAAGTLAPGAYYLVAVLDPDNAITEVSDTNNTIRLTRSFSTGPEFWAQGVTLGATQATAGTQVQASVEFRTDRGSPYVGDVPYRLYWSTNRIVDEGDIPAGDFTVTLAADTASPVTASAQITVPAAAGLYRVVAQLDPDNTIPEVTEANNVAASNAQLRNAPDFTCDRPVVSPALLLKGEQVRVQARVHNTGVPIIGNVQVQVFASSDDSFSAGDDVLVHQGYAFFDPDHPQLTDVDARFAFQALDGAAALPTGAYQFFLRVNPQNQPAETDTANNVSDASAVIRTRAPNLMFETLSGPQRAFIDRDYPIDLAIKNDADVSAEGFFVSVRRSDNRTVRLSDPELGLLGPFSLAGNETLTLTTTVAIQAGTPAGDYFFGAILDVTNDVNEADERDNIAVLRPVGTTTATVTVGAPTANLRARVLGIPDYAGAGEPVIMERVIENTGTLDATDVDYAYYLSADPTIDTSDLEIGRFRADLTWDAAANVGTDRVLLSAEIAGGDYYLGIIIDPDNTVAELDEADNAHSLDRLEVFSASVRFVQPELPPAQLGVPYEAGLFATGGAQAVVRWELAAGSLPPGLALDATTGILTGSPTEAGSFSFTAKATTNGGSSAEQRFNLRVDAFSAPLQLATQTLPPARLGQVYQAQLLAVGGRAPYRWAADGALPAGLSLSPEGALSGTPTSSEPATLRVQVSDADDAHATGVLALRVLREDAHLLIEAPTIPPTNVGRLITIDFTATPASDDLHWTLIDGPEGASMDEDTGRFALRPTAAGDFPCTVQVEDAAGSSDRISFILRVKSQGQLTILAPDPNNSDDSNYQLKSGRYQLTFTATGGSEPYTWTLLRGAGNLPQSFELSEQGVLTGSAEKGGDYSFLVQVRDTTGLVERASYALHIPGAAKAFEFGEDDGCSCATTPRGSLPGSLAVLGLGLLMLLGRGRGRARGRALRAASLLVFAVGALPATAQPIAGTPYIRSEQSITYTSAPQPVGTETCITTGDGGQKNITLPFTVRLYEQDFTTLRASVDGALALYSGSSSPAIHYNSSVLGTGVGAANLVAPLWTDLSGYGANGSPCFWTYYEGTAPNRAIVFEWENYSTYNHYNDVFNFRVRLHEGPAGQIDFEYGTMTSQSSTWRYSSGLQDHQRARPVLAQPSCTERCRYSDLLQNTRITFIQEADDLTPEDIQAPERGFSGERLRVPVSVKSMAGAPVEDIVATLELRAGPEEDAALLYTAAAATFPSVPGHGTADAVFQVVLPYTAEERTVFPHLRVDTTNVFTETNEDNNWMVGDAITVLPSSTPDLMIWGLSCTHTATVTAGSSLDVTVQAGNAGSPAATAQLAIVLSKNPAITSQDTVLAELSQTFAPGEVVEMTRTVQVPAGLPTGNYYLGALIDGPSAVQERSELNNSMLYPTPIVVAGDGLGIATEKLPQARLGRAYAAQLTAMGTAEAVRWRVSNGDLPEGLRLSADGQLRGTPSAVGVASFTVEVTAGADTAQSVLSLTVVDPAAPLTILNTALQRGVAKESYRQPLVSTGGAGPLSWSVTGLPKGLQVKPAAEGQLAQLAGVATEAGTFTVQLTATRGEASVTKELPLVITPYPLLSIVGATLPTGKVGAAYTADLKASGGTPPYRWSSKDDALTKIGLSLGVDGHISGKPTKIGTFQARVRLGDSGTEAAWDEVELFITVSASGDFRIATDALHAATKSQRYVTSIRASGGIPPYTWSLADKDALPAGLELTTGRTSGELEISGTTDEVGLYSLLVQAQDDTGATTERAIALRVEAPAQAVAEDSGCACHGAADNAAGLSLAGLFGLLLLLRRRR